MCNCSVIKSNALLGFVSWFVFLIYKIHKKTHTLEEFMNVLTVALFAVSTEFKTWMTHAAKGAQHVDTTVGALGTAGTALINV